MSAAYRTGEMKDTGLWPKSSFATRRFVLLVAAAPIAACIVLGVMVKHVPERTVVVHEKPDACIEQSPKRDFDAQQSACSHPDHKAELLGNIVWCRCPKQKETP